MKSVYIVQMTFSGVKNYVVGVFENLEDAEEVATDKMSKITNDYYWVDGVPGTKFLVENAKEKIQVMLTVKKYLVNNK